MSTTVANFDLQLPNASTTTTPEGAAFTLPIVIFLSFVSAIAIIVTIVGNVMVIVAFATERRLRCISHYFILSMSIADLTVGCCSMPIYTSYILLARWPLGAVICDIWLSLDFLCCAASVLGILLISIDRYLCLSNPMTYRQIMTRRRAMFLIIVSWILSAILFSVPIIGWQYIEGERTVAQDQCEVQFFGNPVYTTGSIVFIYWLPLLVILILYGRIYLLTRKLVKREAKIIGRLSTRETSARTSQHQIRHRVSDNHEEVCVPNDMESDDWDDMALKMDSHNLDKLPTIPQCETNLSSSPPSNNNHTNGCSHPLPQAGTNSPFDSPRSPAQKKQPNFVESFDIRKARVHSSCAGKEDDKTYKNHFDRLPSNNKALYRFSKDGGPSFSRISTESDAEVDPERSKATRPGSCQSLTSEKKSIKSVLNVKEHNLARTLTSVIMSLKEAKAVRTLSVLLGAFVLCWTPYSILVIIRSWCPESCGISDNLFSFSYYLCYINSTFNPVCYALANRGFRVAFKRMLTCGKRRYEWKDTL